MQEAGAAAGALGLDWEDSAGVSAPLYDIVDVVFELGSRGFFRRQVWERSKGRMRTPRLARLQGSCLGFALSLAALPLYSCGSENTCRSQAAQSNAVLLYPFARRLKGMKVSCHRSICSMLMQTMSPTHPGRLQIFTVGRQALSLVAGGAIDVFLLGQLRLLRQEHTLARAIHAIQASLWPGGTWFMYRPERKKPPVRQLPVKDHGGLSPQTVDTSHASLASPLEGELLEA